MPAYRKCNPESQDRTWAKVLGKNESIHVSSKTVLLYDKQSPFDAISLSVLCGSSELPKFTDGENGR